MDCKRMAHLRGPDNSPGGGRLKGYLAPVAIGAIHSILDAGFRVPGDIAVIGSGNLHYDSELRIPLSSIDQQTDLIGERAARLTLSLLESKTPPRNRTFII